MKRKIILAATLCAAIMLGTIAIASDPGSVGDPLITLQWIKDTFIPQTVAKAEERIDGKHTDTSAQTDGTETELRLKRGDVLRLESGSQLIPLSGTLTGIFSGAVVDLTDGNELRSGASLILAHRYLPAEKSSGTFTVTSDTAVARLSGKFTTTLSAETDYNAMADALKAMGLFRGSDTPYGLGYDLELQPTRIQGMILFLRLLGEEQTALRYTGTTQFADVPDWALPYVAYAFDKGYTKGVGTDADGRVVFDSNSTMTAEHYVSFLLRALSYQEEVDFNWNTSVTDAVRLNMFTTGEGTQVTQKPFLRAQTVYLSYYALSVPVKGSSQRLLDRLIASGAVDAKAASSAIASVKGERL